MNANGIVSGDYAYWIGDEGVKATVNLINEYKDEPKDSEEYRMGLVVSQSNAIASMGGLDFLEDGLEGADVLGRLASLRQLEVLANELGGGDGVINLKDRYFDMTNQSQGVISNVPEGGLRLDLTTELEKTSGFLLNGAMFEYGPSWTLVRNFYQNYRVDPDNPVMNVQGRSPRPMRAERNDNGWAAVPGIAPVLVGIELGFGIKRRFDNPNLAAVTVTPVVALANPYDVALEEETYLVRWVSANSSGDQLGPNIRIRIISDSAGSDSAGERKVLQSGSDFTASENLHLNRFIPNYDPGARFVNDLRFKITTSFAPGEIKVFSLSDDIVYQTDPLEDGLDTVHALEEGLYYGQAELITDSPDMLSELELQEGEELAVISAGGRNARQFVYKATDGDGKEVNVIKPGGSNGNDGRGSGTYPYVLTAIQTNSPGANGRQINLNNSDVSLRQTLVLEGSDWVGSTSVVEHAPVKAMELFNVRAPTFWGMKTSSGHLKGGLVYAAQFSSAAVASKLDPFALWERDSIINVSGIPQYCLLLFHVPRSPISSIGELQHLNFAKDDHSPTFQVGNSFPNPFLSPEAIEDVDGTYNSHWMDLPWVLNDLLWDRYYFSTLEVDGETGEYRVRNSRYAIIGDRQASSESALSDPRKVAGQMMVNGQFNVNSTSVEAWKAVLLGTMGLDVPYDDPATGETGVEKPTGAPVLRKTWALGKESRQPATGQVDDMFWRGYRSLTEDEAQKLAEKIVSEVKSRGPFRSLAEFVNRARDKNNIAHSARGALQAAIDRSGINPQGTSNQRFNSVIPSGVYEFPEAIVYEENGETIVPGSRLLGGPGTITQADLLSLIGPFINVRSDTFVIRAYGDARDPLLGNITARVWCEAVVQRLPEYVDSGNDPEAKPGDSGFSEINQQFGRRFVITSFRWLSENEI